MQDIPCADDPEPSDRPPAGPLYVPVRYVPVRPGPGGSCAARLFRTPLGDRTTVGFTSSRRLTDALGDGQPWIRLAAPALLALTAPLGVDRLTVDPAFVAPAPKPATLRTANPRRTAVLQEV
ncbi:SAV_915 family protein [Streptomyces sp. NPDC091292]|uniref:SAV_915 family protein n=1 Tax=Streptomyces sp. NPDC091292 TaxID=3365991 RepID=UPI00380D2948